VTSKISLTSNSSNSRQLSVPLEAPLPLKLYSSIHQTGITDPAWPVEVPDGVTADEYERYRGAIDRQGFVTIMTADLKANSKAELKELLRKLTDFAYFEMSRKPSERRMRPLDPQRLPKSYRLTITIGFGSSLFLTEKGDDRFDIHHLKPSSLKRMISLPGDAPNFSPADTASDLIFVIASDHPYVNIHVARRLTKHVDPRINVKHLEQAFSRPDLLEFLGFEDGTDNIRNWPQDDMDRLAYITERENEPEWCIGGSYLVYRKIREDLTVWENLSHHRDEMIKKQEAIIGRHKDSGLPLSRKKGPPDDRTPIFSDPADPKDGPLSAHIRKVQPRRPYPDIFGVDDLDRRFLRRPYSNYIDGVDENGEIRTGLNFIAFMRNIREQFEYVATMWQMNPDFPVKGTGIDALYAHHILSTIYGGYYFCPPAPRNKHDFIGSVLCQ
jgi:deferrochelatase/peroxidase EfeB